MDTKGWAYLNWLEVNDLRDIRGDFNQLVKKLPVSAPVAEPVDATE